MPEYTFTFNEGDPTTYYAEFTEPNTFLTYSTLSTGTVEVSGTSGNSPTEIIIPAMIFRSDIPASRVTEIGYGALDYLYTTTSITIPDTIITIGENAFYMNQAVTEYNFGENSQLTTIEQRAFYRNPLLQSIELPNTVTYIGFEGFISCSSLTSFTIPEKVETIGDYAFYDCTNLTQLTIESATVYQSATAEYSVGSALLNNNIRIYVPIDIVDKYDSTYIEDTNNYSRSISGNYYVFSKTLDFIFTTSDADATATLTSYTGSATSVTIPETFSLNEDREAIVGTDYTVTAIGDSGMFSGPFSQVSSTLQNVILPETLEYIGAHAFYACIGLVSITIPDNVTNIGERAFGFCSNLTNVTLPNNSISIGIYAFTNCTSLQSITIPAGLESIGENAFLDCTSLNTVTLENINIYQSIDGDTSAGSILSHASTIYVPLNIVNDYDSAYLEDANFFTYSASGDIYVFNRRTLEFTFTTSGSEGTVTGYTGYSSNVVIPETFSLYNGVAIYGTDYTVTAIGDNAFKGNLNLRTIEIPNSVTSIGNSAFENCTCLTTIMSMNGVRSIGNSAFADCSSLTNLTIPASASADISIGQSAFASCISLTSVIIPTGIASMGIRAFWGCYALAEVYNYSSTTITAGAITGSTNSHFGNLGQYARVVHNSTDMSGGRPASRIEVYNNVQYYVYSNTRIALAPSIARISLTSVALHNSTTEITPYAFSGCTNLESVTIPYGVDTIGYYAFSDCTSLNSITIPASVDEMDIWVFSNCSNLTTITIESIQVYTTLDADDTSGIIENATTIYVPQHIVNEYTNNYLNNTSYYRRSPSGSYYVFTKV